MMILHILIVVEAWWRSASVHPELIPEPERHADEMP
jgi:hypothetical protein